MKKKTARKFAKLASRLYDEIFDDYASTAEQWRDFDDYLARATSRIHAIVARRTRAIVTLVMEEHYDYFRGTGGLG